MSAHHPGHPTLQSIPSARRRPTREVTVGNIGIGGTNPVRVQSMLTSDTLDTEACVRETLSLVEAGCEIVRLTAQTVRHAANLKSIKERLLAAGCSVPLVADIHFKPAAAMEAAKWVEKVRINPGNFVDSKKFSVKTYADGEYMSELERVRDAFTPLVLLCKERGVAMRIGTNHGSLSDRIMNRYGDTPRGMVESALEFAKIARDNDFHQFVFSMKASNPKVMIQAYRLLAATLQELGAGWNYPLHLGVTEAGDGEDGRIKSAIGIGSLLADGLGDTIRVSLTEDSICEIPVANALVEALGSGDSAGDALCALGNETVALPFDPFSYRRRQSQRVEMGGHGVGGGEYIRVFTTEKCFAQLASELQQLGECQPEIILESAGVIAIDPREGREVALLNENAQHCVVTVKDGLELPVVDAFRILAAQVEARHPILLKDTLALSNNLTGGASADEGSDSLRRLLIAAANMGSLLCDGIGDAVLVRCEPDSERSVRLAYNILQSAGARIFRTEYVACPSCGRTLFNLQETTAKVRAATGHLKGVKIAIMGCIVNGPGEMADADFGYVGGAPGKINLYVGKTPVKFNIPEGEAVQRLVELISEHGKWVEPENNGSD